MKPKARFPNKRKSTVKKYVFRCFLLHLGYIGNERKAERKILLRNFSGYSDFRNQAEADKFKPTHRQKNSQLLK